MEPSEWQVSRNPLNDVNCLLVTCLCMLFCVQNLKKNENETKLTCCSSVIEKHKQTC